MAALTREACCELHPTLTSRSALISQARRPGRDRLPCGTEFQFSATTSPLLRPAEGSRIPLTWSLAPGGWDGLSRLQDSAGAERKAGGRSANVLIEKEKENLRSM